MNLISDSLCDDANNAKEVMELVFREMKKGNIIIIQKREEEYQIMLLGEKEGEQS